MEGTNIKTGQGPAINANTNANTKVNIMANAPTKLLHTRQICFLLCTYTACTKLLLLPTTLADLCQNDLWVPLLVCYLLNGLAVWAAAFACSKTQQTLYNLLCNRVGVVFTKLLFFLLALFFLTASVIPMGEQKLYVQNVFYDTLPSLLAFLPFFLFSVYAATKSFQNVGRCADVCFFLFWVAYIVIVGMSIGECRFGALLPVFKTPSKTLFMGFTASICRFPEGAYVLLFMGKFQCRKGDVTKITLSYAAGGVAVLFFFCIFCGVFSYLMPNRLFAVAQVAQYFPAISVLGRVDLLVLYVLELVMLFAVVFQLQACVFCLQTVWQKPQPVVWSVGIHLLLLAVTILFDYKFFVVQQFYAQWLWIAFVVFALLLPWLSPLLVKLCQRGKNKNGTQQKAKGEHGHA